MRLDGDRRGGSKLESAYRLIPIDRLKINAFRLLGKIGDSRRQESSSGGAGNEDAGNQLKQASMMIRVIEDRYNAMDREGDSAEALGIDYDLRDLKAKYSKLVEGTSKGTSLSDAPLSGGSSVEKDDVGNASGDDAEDADTFDANEMPSQLVNISRKKKPRIARRLASVKFQAKPVNTQQSRKRQRRKKMRKEKDIDALNELIKFRKELNLDSGDLHASSYDNNAAQEERDRQMQDILETAKALKAATLTTKSKVSQSGKVMEDFHSKLEKMVDKTGTLNKKTKDSLNATWDVLKIQCSILIFAVVAVVVLFFVVRIFPKQF